MHLEGVSIADKLGFSSVDEMLQYYQKQTWRQDGLGATDLSDDIIKLIGFANEQQSSIGHLAEQIAILVEIIACMRRAAMAAARRLETHGGHNWPDSAAAYRIIMDALLSNGNEADGDQTKEVP